LREELNSRTRSPIPDGFIGAVTAAIGEARGLGNRQPRVAALVRPLAGWWGRASGLVLLR
jgi:hypothetical protein